MNIRVNKTTLLSTLFLWNKYMKRKVRIIACGGTALTLLNLKESTKDVGFLIPEQSEYRYLIKNMMDLGYKQATGTGWQKDQGFIFDLFVGKTIFTTELLESPLEPGNHIPYKEFSSLYLGILNYYDLIISKLFKFTPVDRDDCVTLFKEKNKEIDLDKLKSRFYETSVYDISDEKNRNNFKHFLELLKKEKILDG